MSRSFFTLYNLCRKDADTRCEEKLLRLLNEVEDYMRLGTYSSYRYCKLFTSYLLDGLSESEIASAIGLKESTVRVTKRNLANSLFTMLGDDFFLVAGKGDSASIAECRKRLYICNSYNSGCADYIPYDCRLEILKECPKSNLVDVDIRDCKEEVSFLVRHSKQDISRGVALLDASKLKYLLDVLDGTAGSTSDRYGFMRTLDKIERQMVNTDE